ncbi:hypothetical protein B0H19DRAFT_956591 [Mycena capillaripes]|nr:hypothetical protein B0H19DRAFT_956591 [Mycena capillaripes]
MRSINSHVQRDAGALASASWISTTNPDGSVSTSTGPVAFLKSLESPPGKTAESAVISIAAVGRFTVWVNQQPIGASTVQDSALVLRAELNASVNIFSVLADNFGGTGAKPAPPGLLASVQVSYTDSTTSTFISDASWLATRNISSDFPAPADLSPFKPAVVASGYGSGGQSVSLPSPDPSPLTLNDSTWIWSTKNASTAAAVGSVGFRKTFLTPSGKVGGAESATILLSANDSYALYLNGKYLGSPPADTAGQYAQQFTSVELDSSQNVFTVIAQNLPDTNGNSSSTSAGFIAAIKILYADGTSDIIRTNSSWLDSNGTSTSVQAFLSTSSEDLSPAVAQGPFGMAPWGQLNGVSDVLSAARVPTAPFVLPGSAASFAAHKKPVPVGAIVGALWGVVILALLIFVVWRRRQRIRTWCRMRRSHSTMSSQATDESPSEKVQRSV